MPLPAVCGSVIGVVLVVVVIVIILAVLMVDLVQHDAEDVGAGLLHHLDGALGSLLLDVAGGHNEDNPIAPAA